MKKLLIAALLAASTSAFAAGEDIKGIKIGMTKAEVAALFPKGTKGMTIAGVSNMYAGSDPVEYDKDDKVESVIFFYKNDGFREILQAVKTKYPALKCKFSEVSNRMNAKFDQVECSIGDLSLTRIVDSIDDGSISLMSKEKVSKDAADRKAKQAKDI